MTVSGEDEDEEFEPPLPPDDRLWRHPSELGATESARDARKLTTELEDRGRGRVGLAIASAAVGGVVVVGLLLATGQLAREPGGPPVIERIQSEVPVDDAAAVAERAVPAVVRIERPGEDGPVVGTGVIYRDDGHVLTTRALVGQTDEVTVVLDDGSATEARVVGTDQATDLAVVRVEASGLPGIVIGTATDLEAGEQIMAIDAPHADGQSVRVVEGVVQATGVTVEVSPEQTLHAMIQGSEALEGLAAGAILLDQRGALVGIVTGHRPAVDDPGGDDGAERPTGPYATPIETARDVAEEIIETGSAQHPWLGVEIDTSEPEGGEPSPDDGATVVSVTPGSPAERAGLDEGDMIVAVAGVPVTGVADLVTELRTHRPGDTVIVAYERAGRTETCEPELVDWHPGRGG